jgi:lipopolysaccharide export LptBFGC system permease protein LptF
MVFILHRYIFRELFRVFVLSAVALTLMLSLGSTLRYVQEYGVGPQQVIHLLGYSLPITLTFVLPMAALFAASLVYGRFASDNELDACRASGISLATLVYPGLTLAIMVAIANLILSFYIVPAFVQRAEVSLKADAKKIVFRNIQRKGYYRPPDGKFLIYADHADMANDMLSGVVIAERKNCGVGRIITTENSRVQFNPHKKFNELLVTGSNTYQIDSESVYYLGLSSFSMEFPHLMSDAIKFKKIDKIKSIAKDPLLFSPVEKLARQTYAQFVAELLGQNITAGLTENPEGIYKLQNGQKVIEFKAGKCAPQDNKSVLLSGNVVLAEYDADSKQLLRTLHSQKVQLQIDGDEFVPTITMEIYNPNWKMANGSEGLAGQQFVRGLILPGAVTEKLKNDSILDTLQSTAIASAIRKPSHKLTSLQHSLENRIYDMMAEIRAEMNSRLVFGIGCIALIMIGTGLGIIKRGGHLLSAFGISSIPAAVLIVCIMMGKNLTTNREALACSGVMLMWGGLAVLSAPAIFLYRRLLRH